MILSLDQSTSSTKAVLFDTAGKVLDKAARDHRQIYPQPGWVEHDPEEIFQNVLGVVREIAERNRAAISKLAAISIANQRETIVVFDRSTGKPLHNAIVWQCRRGEPICAELRAQGKEDLIRTRTGLRVDTYFSASKLKWLIREQPRVREALAKGEALIGTIDAWLIYRLTSGSVFATEHTNASRTLLFDITRLRWDEELCALFDVPMRALPEVRESASRFGETTADGILPQAVPICGVMGDSQASLFAQGCAQPGMAKATFGTGTSLMLNIGGAPRISNSGAVAALAWVFRGKPTYALEGIINFSAATIEWLKNQLGLIRDAGEVEALATSVSDNGGVYLVPAFAGLSAPYWNPNARAAIVGLSGHSKREHVVRAALESIAYQIRDVLEMIASDSPVPLTQLRADGGPTRNAFLMQFTADVTGVEIEVANVAESSAWGAALNGLLGLGVYSSLESVTGIRRETKTFRPQISREQAQGMQENWRKAVKRVL